ncbi:hypothetical protein [Streptomyces tsukubensis]|uniref:Uncharacterized protein n=1 Tax=Streptomyces tsukubensis TaxID=83656 RepID=A0A1V4A5X8_9ACTN|nr:hypothetical protein [Streptomyces tsukubensis]OON77019.1 hypothetical protein B1H18_19980 [Streptomyces tsukubensis]QFR93742.1 hypothetical protein GBW32_12510 [Streptomyces tsukubensis]
MSAVGYRPHPSPSHRRAGLCEVTSGGRAPLRWMWAARAQWALRISEGLDPERLGLARGTLAQPDLRTSEGLESELP